jgi:hypothetical protein
MRSVACLSPGNNVKSPQVITDGRHILLHSAKKTGSLLQFTTYGYLSVEQESVEELFMSFSHQGLDIQNSEHNRTRITLPLTIQ